MSEPSHRTYSFGAFTLDLDRGCLLNAGQEIKLRPKSFEILMRLVERRGQLLSKAELMQTVWPDTFVTDDSLVQCLIDVRRALGDEGQRYVKTIPRRGYIFDAEVVEQIRPAPEKLYAERTAGLRVVIEEVEESNEKEGEGLAETSRFPVVSKTPGRRLRRRKVLLTSSLTIIGLGVALSYLWSSGWPKPAAKASPRSIAVLPFKPLVANERDGALELGMADTLITKLSGLKLLIVRPTSAVRNYTALDQDPLAAGREQKVDTVLEGSIQRSGDKVRVTVRLMDVRNGAPLWAYKFDEPYVEIFAVQDAISEKVVEALALNLTGEEKRQMAKRYTGNPDAYLLYIKGVFLRNQMTEEGLKKSIELFQKAMELDPNYVLAYTGQASSYSPLAYFELIPVREAETRNRPLIMKALELDETLAEAHAALAEFKLFIEWDWDGAEREFKRAIELNPSEELTRLLYPDLLLIKGRTEEAIAMSKLALEADPLSPRTGKALAWVYYWAGQYDQAIEQFNKTRELFPNHPLINLGPSYERKKMYDQAVKEYLDTEARLRIPAEEIAALRQAYAASGWRGYWQKRVELAKADAKRKPVQAIFLAELYARLGEKDQALEWLERAYEERNMALIFLNLDQNWESLRSDSRFQSLLRRMRLAR